MSYDPGFEQDTPEFLDRIQGGFDSFRDNLRDFFDSPRDWFEGFRERHPMPEIDPSREYEFPDRLRFMLTPAEQLMYEDRYGQDVWVGGGMLPTSLVLDRRAREAAEAEPSAPAMAPAPTGLPASYNQMYEPGAIERSPLSPLYDFSRYGDPAVDAETDAMVSGDIDAPNPLTDMSAPLIGSEAEPEAATSVSTGYRLTAEDIGRLPLELAIDTMPNDIATQAQLAWLMSNPAPLPETPTMDPALRQRIDDITTRNNDMIDAARRRREELSRLNTMTRNAPSLGLGLGSLYDNPGDREMNPPFRPYYPR